MAIAGLGIGTFAVSLENPAAPSTFMLGESQADLTTGASSEEVPVSSSEVTSSTSSSSATPTDTQDVSLEGAKDVTVDDALLVQSGIYQRGTVLSFYAWNGKIMSGVASR